MSVLSVVVLFFDCFNIQVVEWRINDVIFTDDGIREQVKLESQTKTREDRPI